jgi:hypothetical protein
VKPEQRNHFGGKSYGKNDFVKEDEFMLRLAEKIPVASRKHRVRTAAKAAINCEALEDRKLLSLGFFGAGRRDGFFGGGSLGLGGGMRSPILLLTAPLLDSGGGPTARPSKSVFSSSAVQQAFQTLQTDLENDIPSGSKPTHASVGALQDDLDAIRAGTLTGSAAETKIQADQAARNYLLDRRRRRNES